MGRCQTSRRLGVRPLGVLLGGSIALAAACGGADQPAGSAVRIDAAEATLRFARSTVRADAGRTTITMANPSAIPHAVAIRGHGSDATGKTVGRDGTSRIEVDLEPGTYELYCPVGGHEEAGMTATLVVR
jgi:plastocyanin